MRPTTIKLVRERPATVYEFWFEPIGWAFVTVCDATGLLSIVSDWGNFDHCWLAKAFGKVLLPLPPTWHPPLALPSRERTLTEFLAEMDAVDYVATKLTQTDRRRFDVVDPKATLAELRVLIVSKRREMAHRKGDLAGARQAAREAWNAAVEFVDEIAPSGDNFWDVLDRNDELKPYLYDDEPWEVLQRRDTRCLDALCETILPALFAHLRSLTSPPTVAQEAA